MSFALGLFLVVFGPPLALGLLGTRFWKWSQLEGLTGRTRIVRLGGLVLLAGAFTFALYFMILVLSSATPSAHAPSSSAWPWAHEHPITLVLLADIVALLLLVSQPSRRVAALCFGAGALLTFGGLDVYWYLTDHQDDLMQDFRQSSVEYDRSGWQRAVIDSFEVQVKHRRDIQRLYLSEPAFPGGPVALQSLMKTLTRPQTKPLPQDAIVDVEFILESDGRITLPHVVYGLGPGYDEEAVRVVESLPPFSPSLDDEGKPVARVWRVQVPFFH